MTERVYLHVGSPKSGTTYLQRVLEANRSRLADAGVLLVGEHHLDRIHAAMAVREDPRLDALPPRRRQAWAQLVQQIRDWSGPRAVLSYELFSGASAEQAARAVGDLGAHGIEVHVVVTSRDLGSAIPSAWQERLKFGLRRRLEAWRPPAEAAERSEWGWRTMDPAAVARRWGGSLPPDRVHVVTAPRAGGDPAELWRRFASATELLDVDVDLAVGRTNESLGVVEAELLRRVNGRLPEPLRSTNREQAIWLRDLLAHRVLAGLGEERIGVTEAQLAEAAATADAARAAIEAAGYRVHGDLDDLRATGTVTARLPGSVAEAELLDSAIETIVALLMEVRDRAADDAPVEDVASGPAPARLARTVVRRTVGARVQRRDRELRARIEELEAEVAAARGLHLRVAALQDVVAELLLPPRSRDGRVTAQALRRYRKESM